MPLSDKREREVDVAYALETSPCVVGAYALAVPPSAVDHPDALQFGVVLRPYTAKALASTHFALLQGTHHEVTGRVLYADADWPPSRLFAHGRRLLVEPHERHEARARFLVRATENVRQWRLEEEGMVAALERAFETGGGEPRGREALRLRRERGADRGGGAAVEAVTRALASGERGRSAQADCSGAEDLSAASYTPRRNGDEDVCRARNTQEEETPCP